MSHSILIVAQDTSLASRLVTWLGQAGHELVLATTYSSAKLHLTTRPKLLITELRLGEYNGLHLALRAQAAGIPTILLAPADDYFEREASRFGAAYVEPDQLECEELHGIIAKLLETEQETETTAVPWPVQGDLTVATKPLVLH